MPSSTFLQPGDPDGTHFYGRNGNPTVEAVETELGLLEDAESLLFPSGMAAISAVFHSVLTSGSTVLCHADGYYNARGLLTEFFEPQGVTVRACPTREMCDADLSGVNLVLAETPSNPGLDICDIAHLSARTSAAGALLMVDNTTATPLCQRPLDLGADVTVMADTKAMAGHSDVLVGHVASRNSALMQRIGTWRRLSGAIVSPFDAWLLHRGLETLELRVGRANDNALAVAKALRGAKGVEDVRYPGLSDNRDHAIAARQMSGFGPIVSIVLANRRAAEAFIDATPLLIAATSFGGVHSSAECRVRWGDDVPEGFVRIACGIEPTEELVGAMLATLDGLS